MKDFCRLCLLILVLLTGSFKHASAQIKNYSFYSGIGEVKGQKYVVIRKYISNNTPYYLCVNPGNIETFIVSGNELKVKEATGSQIYRDFSKTPYLQLIKDAYHNSTRLQDAGITHISASRSYVITTDLCPSKKPLDYELYQSIIQNFGKIKPIPISISISGKWMKQHPDGLIWLKQMNDAKNFRITWINHSYTHPYKKNSPLNNDFLLENGVNLNYEVLATEQALLEQGITPSVFFRFPGLVSDQTIFDHIVEMGLIPIGSNAWLAKGQTLKAGSIVLLHGNCNEPVGVKKFIRYLSKEQKESQKEILFPEDLRKGLISLCHP